MSRFLFHKDNEVIDLEQEPKRMWGEYIPLHERITLPPHQELYDAVAWQMRNAIFILDVGAGTGKMERHPLLAGVAKITAVDITKEAVQIGKRVTDPLRVQYLEQDSMELDIRGDHIRIYDAAISLLHLYAVSEPQRQIEIIKKHVGAGGRISIANMTSAWDLDVLIERERENLDDLVTRNVVSERDVENYLTCNRFISIRTKEEIVAGRFHPTDLHALMAMGERAGLRILEGNDQYFHGQVANVLFEK